MTKLLTFSVVGDSLVAHFAAISAAQCCSAQFGSMKNIEKLARTEDLAEKVPSSEPRILQFQKPPIKCSTIEQLLALLSGRSTRSCTM